MQFAKRVRTNNHRLGEIFLEAGIISPDVLTHGLIIAKRAAMPIGRVLVMSGHVSDLDVECALHTQSSIREGTIDVKMAKELLRFAHVHQVTIDEAYRLNGISRGLGPLPRMGKLVLAAGIVDEVGLRCALRHSTSTGYPLGRALVSLRLIADRTHCVCLNLQVLIRDGQLSFLQAVKVLQSVHSLGVSFDSALKAVGVENPNYGIKPRLGDILVEAQLLSREDSLIIAELGTEGDTAFGQLLMQYGLVSPLVVEAAAQIQRMLSMPMFTKARALRLLALVSSTNLPLEKLLAEFDLLDQVVALLRAAGVIDERTMRDTAASISNFEYSVAEVLIQRGLVTREMTQTAMVLINEIQRGIVSYEKSLDVLRRFAPAHCQRPVSNNSLVAA